MEEGGYSEGNHDGAGDVNRSGSRGCNRLFWLSHNG